MVSSCLLYTSSCCDLLRSISVSISKLFCRTGLCEVSQCDSLNLNRLILSCQAADVRTKSTIDIVIFNGYDLAGLSHNIKDLGRIFAVQDIDICNGYVDSLLFQQICCCKYTIKYITIREQYCICTILFPNGDTCLLYTSRCV